MSEAEKPIQTSPYPSNEQVVSEEVEMEISPTSESSGKLDSEAQAVDDLPNEVSSVTVAESDLGSLGVTPSDQQTATQATADANLVENLRQEIESLKAQLEANNNQTESFKTQYMRIAADFDNFRKRTQKEKEDLEQQVKSATITKLLPVVDDFERARSHIKPQTDGEMAIHKSYQNVYKQLVDNLKRLGVSPMRPEGKEFDPNLHEAVMREATNEHPEGTVLEELVRGYFLGERILRHAMVKVAAPAEPPLTSEESNTDSVES